MRHPVPSCRGALSKRHGAQQYTTRGLPMTLQQLARTIVQTVLSSLDAQTFAGIPDAEIDAAVRAVAQLLRDESSSVVYPSDTPEG